MPPTDPARVANTLLARRQAFKAFLAARLGNEADAEDLLQHGLVKALQHAGEINDAEKIVPWFYQLLRRVLVDHVRSRSAAAKRNEAWMKDTTTLADDAEAERHICACFEKLLPGMKPNQAELLRRVELQGKPVAEVAAELGMSANNASVTLHRARAELKGKLVNFCGDCDCLDDCECE